MLDRLAPHSRVWIFQADRKLSDAEKQIVLERLNEFVPQWASHGNELYGDFTVHENYFIVIGADEQKAPPSGCSIDSMMRVIQDLGAELGVDFLNRLNTLYRDDDGELKLASQLDFKNLIREGKVNEGTKVFNNMIQTKGELVTAWETSVEQSWHKNLLDIA